MGPSRNSLIFESVNSGGTLGRLAEEAKRRVAFGQNLADVSAQFADSTDIEACLISEPVMIRKLVALNTIQLSRLGVAGFNPQTAIGFDHDSSRITAFLAPPHDCFYSDGKPKNEIRTRAIKFNLSDGYTGVSEDDAFVEMFGLNLFIADPDVNLVSGVSDPEQSSTGLLVVSSTGKLQGSYVAGETPIIAVRNTKTGDARAYLLLDSNKEDIPQDLSGDMLMSGPKPGQPIIQENTAWVLFPDGQVQKILVLDGDLLNEVSREFADAAGAFNTEGSEFDRLSTQERAAVTELSADAHGDNLFGLLGRPRFPG